MSQKKNGMKKREFHKNSPNYLIKSLYCISLPRSAINLIRSCAALSEIILSLASWAIFSEALGKVCGNQPFCSRYFVIDVILLTSSNGTFSVKCNFLMRSRISSSRLSISSLFTCFFYCRGWFARAVNRFNSLPSASLSTELRLAKNRFASCGVVIF